MPKLKPYPKYKPTNIQWLGDIPEHWSVERAKYLFQTVDIRSESGNEELLTVSAQHGIVPRKSAKVTMFKAESYAGYKLCWPGDLVINSLWAWAHALGISKYHGIVSSAYGVYRLLPQFNDCPQFIHYLVRSIPFQWELQVRSKGIWISRLQLTDEAFLGAPIPLPPLDEQRAIARYLDHITSRIDTYTSNKRKLVDLLKEYRQALIHQTVTRGLDPDSHDSSVEPMIRLHHLITVSSGARIQFEPDKEDMDAAVSIGGEHIQNYEFSLGDKTRFVPLSFYLDQKSGHIQHGDTLVVKDGATIGKSMFVDHMPAEHMMVNEHVFVLRAVSIDPRYLSFLIEEKTTQDTIWSLVYGAAQPGLSKDFVKFIRVPCVDLEEQRAIANYLNRKTAKIDTAIDLAQREIELLEEYRTRLIADVVTGQLDIRDQNIPATSA